MSQLLQLCAYSNHSNWLHHHNLFWDADSWQTLTGKIERQSKLCDNTVSSDESVRIDEGGRYCHSATHCICCISTNFSSQAQSALVNVKCRCAKQAQYYGLVSRTIVLNQSITLKKTKITSFGQPTSLIARGRASAALLNVNHLCQTKCQWPLDRDAHKPKQRLEREREITML